MYINLKLSENRKMKNITALRNQRLNEIEEKSMIARLDGTNCLSGVLDRIHQLQDR